MMATKGQELVDNFSKWLPMATWQPLMLSPDLSIPLSIYHSITISLFSVTPSILKATSI